MSDVPADPPLLASPAGPRSRLGFWIALALAAHLAGLFIFSAKKPIVPRAPTRVPQLRLLDNGNELVALNDPTLFARPHANDFASAYWLRMPEIPAPSFHWVEPGGELARPRTEELGGALQEFLKTNRLETEALNFKLPPQLSEVTVALENDLPQSTTLQITGALAKRRPLNQIELPSVPLNDVIPASTVQVLADQTGNVTSVILLESSTSDEADGLALQLALRLRFAPAAEPTLGEITFHWHTVPTTRP